MSAAVGTLVTETLHVVDFGFSTTSALPEPALPEPAWMETALPALPSCGALDPRCCDPDPGPTAGCFVGCFLPASNSTSANPAPSARIESPITVTRRPRVALACVY